MCLQWDFRETVNKSMDQSDCQLDLLPSPARCFRPPSLEEVLLAAAKCGLPESEGKKFFCYYEMVDWTVGGKRKMKKWHAALALWRLKWEDRGPASSGYAPRYNSNGPQPSIADKAIGSLLKGLL